MIEAVREKLLEANSLCFGNEILKYWSVESIGIFLRMNLEANVLQETLLEVKLRVKKLYR